MNDQTQSSFLYRLTGVTRRYGEGETEVLALDSIDLEIPAGRFVAVVGPSGSGKSTLLQLLGGLDRADRGTVELEGTDMGKLGDAALADLRLNTFGFVFQQFNLIPTLNAQENVEVALAPSPLPAAERSTVAAELLGKVGLGSRRSHLPSQLSGGEQQRVAIARALTHSPRVLLADEPTGNLDSATGAEVLELLRGVSDDQDQTVILITHDNSIAQKADFLIRMSDGRIDDLAGFDFDDAGTGQEEVTVR